MSGIGPAHEREPTEYYIAHAELRARESPSGIGAAVVLSTYAERGHIWDCIVTDADTNEWHYIHVLGLELSPFPNIAPEDVEQGIERFAATLPEENRLLRLLNANPLHIDRDGNITD
jgi:hypothetical protein